MSAATIYGTDITGTSSIKTIAFMVYNSIANPAQKFLVDTNGNLTASTDLKYNGSTSLTTQMATLNGYKTSGTFSATTTFQDIHVLNSAGSRGFITVIGNSHNIGMSIAFFENYPSRSYPSLTAMAMSGNAGMTRNTITKHSWSWHTNSFPANLCECYHSG